MQNNAEDCYKSLNSQNGATGNLYLAVLKMLRISNQCYIMLMNVEHIDHPMVSGNTAPTDNMISKY